MQQPPTESRSKLVQLRKIIKAAAPKADEASATQFRIMNTTEHSSTSLRSKTILVFFVPPPIIEEHELELKAYGTAQATVRFPIGKPLPGALIKKLVKARIKRSEAVSNNRIRRQRKT